MTRNVAENHRPAGGGDPTRFDLPPERYRMAIGGVDGAVAQVSATDPLSGETVPVEKISGVGDELVVEMPVTDSPRLLMIQEVPPVTDSPSGGGTTGNPPRATRAPGLRLRGTQGLLRRHRLRVEVECGSSCPLRLVGRLRIGSREFKLKTGPAGPVVDRSGGIDLRIAAGVASIARSALDRGTQVRLSVSAVPAAGGAAAEPAARVVPIRRG